MSPDGATTQAVLMTIYRTLERRGHQPLEVLVDALRTYVKSGLFLRFRTRPQLADGLRKGNLQKSA